MAFTLNIAAANHTSDLDQASGVEIDLPFNERGTARFTTRDGYVPALRSEVSIYDGATPIFGGVVFQRRTLGFHDVHKTECECVDWTWYFDHLTVAGGTLTGTITLKAVLQWLQTNYFAAYGFTLDATQADGPSATVTGFTWERKVASEVLRDLTTWSGGWIFQVDPDKEWRFVQPSLGTPTAPFSITGTNGTARELNWEETSEAYATKIIVVFGGTGTREKTETFEVDAAIIAAGYYDAELPSTPTGGVTATINAVPATIGGAGNQLVWSFNGGVGGRARITAGTYVPQLGDDIAYTYTAQYPGEAIADASVSPAIERVERRDDLTDRPTAQAVADGLLDAAYQSPRSYAIDTVTPGLWPGQVITIDNSKRSATSTAALITRLSIQMVTQGLWIYRATAINGVYPGSNYAFFRGGGNGGGGSSVTVTYTGGTNPTVGQALTKSDDTNVTLTLGGSPSTALLAATSLTLGWTGQLPVARGGMGWNTVAANSVPYASATDTISTNANLTFNGTVLTIGPGSMRADNPNIFTFRPGTGGYDWQNNAGSLSLMALLDTGDLSVRADIDPKLNYTSNLGSLATKYLTVHAAELWVETLVAQNTIATIGGRILVGPTTTLVADLGSGAGEVYPVFKHNQGDKDDIVHLGADGKVEWMKILGWNISAVDAGLTWVEVGAGLGDISAVFVAGHVITIRGNSNNNGDWTIASASYTGSATRITITGTFAGSAADGYVVYTRAAAGAYKTFVTRNLDGSGANQWYAGDAVFNTGTTGDGFIDLYSVAGVLSGAGPTIVGNVRTGTTYNNLAARWAIGNLNGLYGMGSSDIYGVAFGDPSATNITIDATNGLRIRSGTTNKLVADTSGNLSLVGDLSIGTSGVLRSGATAYGTGTGYWLAYNGGTPQMRVGNPSGNRVSWDGTDLIVRSANLQIDTSGILIDQVRYDSGSLPDEGFVGATGYEYGFQSGGTVLGTFFGWGRSDINSDTIGLGLNARGTGRIITDLIDGSDTYRSVVRHDVTSTTADWSARVEQFALGVWGAKAEINLASTGVSRFYTARGSVSANHASATTLFPLPDENGFYLVFAMIASSGSASNHTAFAHVMVEDSGGGTARIAADNGGQLTLTLSGLNVQATQSSGSTATVSWTYLRL